MHSQTQVFRRLVHEHMSRAPLRLSPGASVRELVEALARERASSAVVVDEAGRPLGILTEQDVARRIAFRLAPETPVEAVMSTPVVSIDECDYLFHAVAFMRRRGLRHIPVLDASGAVTGMLAQHDAIAYLAGQTMALIERLTHEESLEGLKAVKTAQVELADALLQDDVPVPEVQALITEINSDIHRRITRRALADMAEDGWGAPPVAFSLIVMGSGGRGENFLFPDQDNGLILADYEDREHATIDAFFLELAARVTRELDAVGFPLCRGNVMATNPVWRKTARQWREQIRYWLGRRSEAVLRYSDIFFDFAHVFGARDLAVELRGFVTTIVQKNPGYIKDMFAIEADHTVALGWFGRLIRERDAENRPGMINLKYRGTLPLVEAVRLLALRHGVAETATVARLDALRDRGVMDEDRHDYLVGAFEHITNLLLRQQIADFNAGRTVSNFVPESALSSREKDYLVACFKAIEELRGRLKSELSGDGF